MGIFWSLKANEISVSITTIVLTQQIFLVEFGLVVLLVLIIVWNKHSLLRLKVFNAKVRGKNVFGKLLLKFFLDLRAKSLVNEGVFGIQSS